MKKTLLIAAALLAGTVQAAPITINFDDGNLHGFTIFSRCAGGGGGAPTPPNSTNFYATPLCGHGRTVAMVTCGGVVVNWRQVQDGLAWCLTKYLTQPAMCLPLEHAAKDARRGLWREDSPPMPPWEFGLRRCSR